MGAISAAVSASGLSVVVSANTNRKQLWLQNMSTEGQIIYLKYGTSGSPSKAVIGQGFRINPNGGNFYTTATGWITATCIGGGYSGTDSGLLIGWEL